MRAMVARRALLGACERHGVVLEAYSPLSTGRHLADPVVAQIAGRLGRTPAQVLLRWCVQREIPVIPKSTQHGRTVGPQAARRIPVKPALAPSPMGEFGFTPLERG